MGRVIFPAGADPAGLGRQFAEPGIRIRSILKKEEPVERQAEGQTAGPGQVFFGLGRDPHHKGAVSEESRFIDPGHPLLYPR